MPKEDLTLEELRRQKKREYDRSYYQKNKEKIIAQTKERYLRDRDRKLAYAREYRQKNREKIYAKYRERYNSDPEYREKRLKLRRVWWERRREAYRQFKIALGGTCTFPGCIESDLEFLVPHHKYRKREKASSFVNSKELTMWMKGGIIPKDVVLMCSNHHLKLENMIARGEADVSAP